MHGIDIDHKHFAALNGKVIVGYYIDVIHDMESLTLPYIEITEELWLALNENSIRNEFINSSDIVYDKIYTINDFHLFQEVSSVDIEVPLTPVELAIEELQDDVQEIQVALDNKVDNMNFEGLSQQVVEMNENIQENAYTIATIVNDYLNSSDKEELNNKIEANSNAIELLTNGVSAEEVDSVNDLIQYVNEHGTEVIAINKNIEDLQIGLDNHFANESNPHKVTKSQVGLENVENKSSETIRSELTRANVTNALGYDNIKAGDGTKSLVINEGDANGKYAIAGGSTDRSMITDLVGTAGLLTSVSAPVANGDASLAFGASTVAHATGTIAAGAESQAGCLGYYFWDINFSTKVITLSTNQKSLLSSKKAPTNLTWAVNDIISIVNNEAYPMCCKITAIDKTNGTITVDALPFTKIDDPTILKPNDRSVYVASKPSSGEVKMGFGALAIGYQNVAAGNLSTAIGYQNKALDTASFVTGRENVGAWGSLVGGYKNIVTGGLSFASGRENTVTGANAHAEGTSNKAEARQSHAEGFETQVTSDGVCGHTEGYQTKVSNIHGHAEGRSTTASGEQAHAEGNGTVASGNRSHAEGRDSVASGVISHAEGYSTTAKGNYSHSEGNLSESSGESSHAEGYNTTSSGSQSHAEGYKTIASSIGSHAEGYETEATYEHSHAEGYQTKAKGTSAHAEGRNTIASGTGSHAEGSGVTASGAQAHAEGFETIASGSRSHAEGNGTTASGDYAHAEGSNAIAKGSRSHAEGWQTRASGENQHVQGKYNIEDTNNEYAHIVGNGSSSARSNAHTLDWNGNAWFKGDIYVGGTKQSEGTNINAAINNLSTLIGDKSVSEQISSAINEVSNTLTNDIQSATAELDANKADTIQTRSGNFITADNSAYTPIKGLTLYGKTTQATTTGKNLVGKAVLSSTAGSTTVDGDIITTEFINGSIHLRSNVSYPAGTYTFSVVPVSSDVKFAIYLYKTSDGTTINQSGSLNWAGGATWTFTASEEFTFNIAGDYQNKGTYSYKLQLESGSVATAYEPYTGGIPSPNPYYPQELVSAGDAGNISVTVCTKNLLDMTKVYASSLTPEALTGATITSECIDFVKQDAYVYSRIPVFLQGGKTYTVWCQMELYDRPSDATGSTSVLCKLLDKYQQWHNITENRTISTTFSVTPATDTTTELQINPNYGSEVPAKARVKIMVVEGQYTSTTIPAFEPYMGQTVTVSTPNGLPAVPAYYSSNYTDSNGQAWICDEIDFARGVHVQRVGIVDLSTLSWTWQTYYWRANTVGNMLCYGNSKQAPLLAEKYTAINANSASTIANVIALANSSYETIPALFIYCNNGSTTETPTGKCYYALAEPIETPLDAEILAAYATLHTNAPYTTIYNDANADMKAVYYTPSTAVQMVHSPEDEGKILTIDQHGCVVLGEAESYTLPVAGSTLGGIVSGGDITIASNGTVSVNDDSHNHIIDNVDGLPEALNSKLPLSGGIITGDFGVNGLSRTSTRYTLPTVNNYTNGILIELGTSPGWQMVTLIIKGNSYASWTLPINSMFQFYDYTEAEGILQPSGVHYGVNFGNLTVYRYNGKLYAHFNQPRTFCTISVEVISGRSDLTPTISNSAIHADGRTAEVVITPTVAKLTDTTYSNATTSVAGLMSATDKSKLDGLKNCRIVEFDTMSYIDDEGDYYYSYSTDLYNSIRADIQNGTIVIIHTNECYIEEYDEYYGSNRYYYPSLDASTNSIRFTSPVDRNRYSYSIDLTSSGYTYEAGYSVKPVTYSLSKSGSDIILTGSNGSVSSVTDATGSSTSTSGIIRTSTATVNASSVTLPDAKFYLVTMNLSLHASYTDTFILDWYGLYDAWSKSGTSARFYRQYPGMSSWYYGLKITAYNSSTQKFTIEAYDGSNGGDGNSLGNILRVSSFS